MCEILRDSDLREIGTLSEAVLAASCSLAGRISPLKLLVEADPPLEKFQTNGASGTPETSVVALDLADNGGSLLLCNSKGTTTIFVGISF